MSLERVSNKDLAEGTQDLLQKLRDCLEELNRRKIDSCLAIYEVRDDIEVATQVLDLRSQKLGLMQITKSEEL